MIYSVFVMILLSLILGFGMCFSAIGIGFISTPWSCSTHSEKKASLIFFSACGLGTFLSAYILYTIPVLWSVMERDYAEILGIVAFAISLFLMCVIFDAMYFCEKKFASGSI